MGINRVVIDEPRPDDRAAGYDHHRVTVGIGLLREVSGNHIPDARTVVDEDRLPEALREFAAYEAGGDVSAARPGWIRRAAGSACWGIPGQLPGTRPP